MKEIDLLPEWYKRSRRLQTSCRTQYIALGCIFGILMICNFIMGRSVSKAAAGLISLEAKQAELQITSNEFARVKNELAQLQRKAAIMEEIDSKIDISSVLGEISFLIDEKIVISKIRLEAESLESGLAAKVKTGLVAGSVKPEFRNNGIPLFGDVRFKVAISGIAAEAGDVAELVCKLEESPYFWMVYPTSSKNRMIKAEADLMGDNVLVNEFEIGCYLANYQPEGPGFVNESQEKKPGI